MIAPAEFDRATEGVHPIVVAAEIALHTRRRVLSVLPLGLADEVNDQLLVARLGMHRRAS